ncbi:MAG: nicotinamide mononucleotide transporter [Oscillospiraceae bacterium]|nr:nicotinamide mononucleotide transporter [Oscillospiraceae bacterium]
MEIKQRKFKLFPGWKLPELIWLLVASMIIFALSIYWGDNWLGITSALTGVWCVIFTGKGKRSSFVFGMVNTLCYIYIAFNVKFYGEVMLNALYYVPMNVVGWLAWTRHMDEGTGEVKKEKLTVKWSFLLYGITVIGIVVYGYILKLMGGNLPYIDSMSTVVAVVAQILSVKRLREQWILWIVVNVVSIVMWGIEFAKGGENIATLAMWSVYLVNAIIMYIKWTKESE